MNGALVDWQQLELDHIAIFGLYVIYLAISGARLRCAPSLFVAIKKANSTRYLWKTKLSVSSPIRAEGPIWLR
jgi:hypothetical protein